MKIPDPIHGCGSIGCAVILLFLVIATARSAIATATKPLDMLKQYHAKIKYVESSQLTKATIPKGFYSSHAVQVATELKDCFERTCGIKFTHDAECVNAISDGGSRAIFRSSPITIGFTVKADRMFYVYVLFHDETPSTKTQNVSPTNDIQNPSAAKGLP